MYYSVDTLNKKLGYPARLVNPIDIQNVDSYRYETLWVYQPTNATYALFKNSPHP